MTTPDSRRIDVSNGSIQLRIWISASGEVSLSGVRPGSADLPAGPGVPIAEVLTVADGKRSGGRYSDTSIGTRLRYVAHEIEAVRSAVVHLRDAVSGLEVDVEICLSRYAAATFTTRVRNASSSTRTLLAVSSLAFADPAFDLAGSAIHAADSDWLAEYRWTAATLRERDQPDISRTGVSTIPRGSYSVSSLGTWSTGKHLPMGGLVAPDGQAAVWQIEHNGPWTWQVADSTTTGLAVIALGPTDLEHQWCHRLEPGEEFESVPVTLAVSSHGFEGAIAELTAYRRDSRIRPKPTNELIVFNDYMNGLMADPSTDKLLPLISAVGGLGADIFCIDAGWYSDAPGWWDLVGEWEPSTTRFPRGITEVFDAIRTAGMRPGLWWEPEVIGVRSRVAERLPDEAFFLRGGERIVEDGRYHLDLSQPDAVAYLDGVVDRLIRTFDLAYLKFDYNVNPGPGTDRTGVSAGAGLLSAARSYLGWIDRLRARHPQLILENCGSGAMRSDWAMMSRFDVQSTSDQEDGGLYVPIAASAATAVLPEQAGNWSYPQRDMPQGEAVTSLVNGLVGRMVLAGRADLLGDTERDLIAAAVGVARSIAPFVRTTVPVWPSGLPRWEDETIVFGLLGASGLLLAVWNRGTSPLDADLLLTGSPLVAGLGDTFADVEQIFPPERARWTLDAGLRLRGRIDAGSAALIRIR